MIKMLAVDMDGTCLDHKSRMTDRTLEALRDAAERGIVVVPATGRNLECLPHRLSEGILKASGTEDAGKNKGMFRYVISSNGACVTDLKERKSVYRAPVEGEQAIKLLEQIRGKRIGIAAHIRHKYLLQGRALTTAGRLIYGKDARNVYCVRNMEEFIRKNDCKVEELQFYFLSSGARKEIKNILAFLPEFHAAYSRIYVEVFSSAASKGRALFELGDHLGIRREEIACIGDGENDLSMFEASSVKIAMGNAVETLKYYADYVTGSNRADGAAEAIERYILGQDPDSVPRETKAERRTNS